LGRALPMWNFCSSDKHAQSEGAGGRAGGYSQYLQDPTLDDASKPDQHCGLSNGGSAVEYCRWGTVEYCTWGIVEYCRWGTVEYCRWGTVEYRRWGTVEYCTEREGDEATVEETGHAAVASDATLLHRRNCIGCIVVVAVASWLHRRIIPHNLARS
jgi:hypothetical protein